MFDEERGDIDGHRQDVPVHEPSLVASRRRKGKDEKVTTWGFEAEGPSTLTRAGIHLKDFTPGTAITITGHPMVNTAARRPHG